MKKTHTFLFFPSPDVDDDTGLGSLRMRVDDIPLLSICIAFTISHDGLFVEISYFLFLLLLSLSLLHFFAHRLCNSTQ